MKFVSSLMTYAYVTAKLASGDIYSYIFLSDRHWIKIWELMDLLCWNKHYFVSIMILALIRVQKNLFQQYMATWSGDTPNKEIKKGSKIYYLKVLCIY